MLRVGVLGAAAIAPPHYVALSAWPQLKLPVCASKGMASTEAAAAKFGIRAATAETLIDDESHDVIVNLTPPQAHFETSRKISNAATIQPPGEELLDARILF